MVRKTAMPVKKGEIAHFRTSIPASPNFRAAYPTNGIAEMTAIGARIFHLSDAPALLATKTARKA